MAKLYITSGLPFSGKTYLAKQLAEKRDLVYLGFDELWVQHEQELPVNKADGWRYVRDLAKQKIAEHLDRGESVVYDETNVAQEHRDELRSLAVVHGAEPVVVFADTPDEIRTERMRVNRTTQERHDVEEHNLREVEAQIERPESEEGVVTYRPEENLDHWIGRLS